MSQSAPKQERPRPLEVFLAFLRLGLVSFGGPVAHLGYFQAEFVKRRRWLTEDAFAEIVAIAQSLPGPASSQVGFALGLLRAGRWGGFAAWLGFTAPSAALMLAFAFGHSLFSGRAGAAVLHGLQLVAVAVVAQAVMIMQKSLAPDRRRLLFAAAAVAVMLYGSARYSTWLAIALGGVAGLLWLRPSAESRFAMANQVAIPKTEGRLAALLFTALLIAAFLFHGRQIGPLSLASSFYRTGAVVFGGGHVVLPLLEGAVVARGWLTQASFLAGYGAAQALPGPLFSFAAYLGAAVRPNPHSLLYGLLTLCSIFLPGLLLMAAVLPHWETIRSQPRVRRALQGINAAVVGVLLAALYRPVWTSTVHTGSDLLIAAAAFTLLTVWKVKPWIVVVLGGAAGWLQALLLQPR